MQNFPIDLHGELDDFVRRFGSISSAEQEYVANLEQHPTPDTTSQEWLNARSYRITGSVCGCIIDQNPYQSAEQFAIKKLWPQPMDERGQMACAWGAKHELDAEQAFAAYLTCHCIDTVWRDDGAVLRSFSLRERGLIISLAHPCLGYSPDGLLDVLLQYPDGTTVWETELVEYKCPISFPRLYEQMLERDDDKLYPSKLVPAPVKHLYNAKLHDRIPDGAYVRYKPRNKPPVVAVVRSFNANSKKYTIVCDGLEYTTSRRMLKIFVPSDEPPRARNIPPYYYSQINFGMHLLDLKRCHFVVWSPGYCSHDVVDRDYAYGKYLISSCLHFWRHTLAPAFVAQMNNALERDSLRFKIDDDDDDDLW